MKNNPILVLLILIIQVCEIGRLWTEYAKHALCFEEIISGGVVKGYCCSPSKITSLVLLIYLLSSKPSSSLEHDESGIPNSLGIRKIGIDGRSVAGPSGTGRVSQVVLSIELLDIGAGQFRANVLPAAIVNMAENTECYDTIFSNKGGSKTTNNTLT